MARAGVILRVACLCVLALSLGEARGSAAAKEHALSTAGERVATSEPALEMPAVQDGLAQGAHPFLTILCKFADEPAEPEPPAFFERLMSAEYPGLDHYWREVSYGQINLAGSHVTGWVTLPGGKASYQAAAGEPDFTRLAHDCAAAGGLASAPGRYFGLNLLFNADLSKPHGGTICLTLGASSGCYGATWIWPVWFRSQASWAHEMGHALGLEHTGRDPGRAYGNVWDVMSENGACGIDSEFGRLAQHISGYQKDLLGWIPSSAKLLLAGQGETTFKLAPLARPSTAAYVYLLARIPIGGSEQHFYTLEARTRVGYDRHLPADALVIHEVDLRLPRPLRAVPAWVRWHGSAGDGLPAPVFHDDRHGITVTVERQDEGGFTATVQIAAGARAAHLIPRSLLASMDRAHERAREIRTNLLAPGEFGGAASRSRDPELVHIPRTELALALDEMDREHSLWIESDEDRTTAFYAVREPGQPLNGEIMLDPGPDPGTMRSPLLAIDNRGAANAVWSQVYQGHWQVSFAVRPSDAADWTQGERISSVAEGDAHALAIAVDSRGRTYVLWQWRYNCNGSRSMTDLFLSLRGEDGRWQLIETVDANSIATSIGEPWLIADAEGNLYAEWQERSPQGDHVYAAFRPIGGPWSGKWEIR